MPVFDRLRRVPTDISAAKCRFASLAVESEDPLLSEGILKISDVDVRIIAVDNWWVTASHNMVIMNLQQRFGHLNSSTFLVTCGVDTKAL
jgi:hypothetical protein